MSKYFPEYYKVEARLQLQESLNALAQIVNVENGNISWPSGPLDRGSFELLYNLKFTPGLSDHVKDGAIWHVLNECARKGDFPSKYFLQQMRSYLRDFIQKPNEPLVAICQINCRHGTILPKTLRSFEGILKFSNNITTSDKRALEQGDSEDDSIGLHNEFMYISSIINATDHRLAIDKAERNILYGLGVLNLTNHGYGISRRFGYPNAPIGRFLTASSIFLVDRRQRKLGGYFSDNRYPQSFKNHFTVSQRVSEAAIGMCKFYSSDLKNIDFREKFIQSVISFQEGLETSSIEFALLKFWTGIEILCSKDEKEDSRKIAERASSIFMNPTHVYMRLNFIQEFRNNIVHKGASGDHALLCAQWGSLILAELIKFFLFNKFKIRCHSDIIQYLSMPTKEDVLIKNISLSKKRLRSLATKMS